MTDLVPATPCVHCPSCRVDGAEARSGLLGGSGAPAVRRPQGGLASLLTEILKGKRFLIVDDNAVNRKVMSKMLARYAVATETAVSGKKAVERLTPPHDIDCVFMDLQMPEMDGYEATSEIRRLEREADPEGGARVPISALTADVVMGTLEKCAAAGMDGFLSKPIEEDQLYRVMNSFFGPPSPT